MFINAFTKEFTLVNNASPSHDVAYEHLLYYKMVANVQDGCQCYTTRWLPIQSFHSNREGDVGQ